jgi:hypothetical protein
LESHHHDAEVALLLLGLLHWMKEQSLAQDKDKVYFSTRKASITVLRGRLGAITKNTVNIFWMKVTDEQTNIR